MINVTKIILNYTNAMYISYKSSQYTQDYILKNNLRIMLENKPDAYYIYAYKNNKPTKLTQKAFQVCSTALRPTFSKKNFILGK